MSDTAEKTLLHLWQSLELLLLQETEDCWIRTWGPSGTFYYLVLLYFITLLKRSELLMGEKLPKVPGHPELRSDTLSRPVRTLRVKMVLLGASGVGKSSLALRFCKNEFRRTSPTVGCEFMTLQWYIGEKRVYSENNSNIYFVMLWKLLFAFCWRLDSKILTILMIP